GAINFDGSEGNFFGNVSFEGNHAIYSGGAVFANGASNTIFGGEVVFANNTADFGGAIYSRDSTNVYITEGGSVSFRNNCANYIEVPYVYITK
ncbi:unnamed protein product, partial [Ascophyllum nodosum]